MSESWREFLYPLGFLSSLIFASRFILQWIGSERMQKSIVTKNFWRLSLAGNLFLLLHSVAQVQFHVGLVQAANAVISWRNLDLMRERGPRFSLKTAVIFILAALLTFFFVFVRFSANSEWFRVPSSPWQISSPEPVSFFWHILGCVGLALFNSRFWFQWWNAEKRQTSYLGPEFWWMSIFGGLFSLAYFFRIGDIVNVIGPAIGLVPYIRNLMLIYQTPSSAKNL
jgi:lipid-A-disaccharide synthase